MTQRPLPTLGACKVDSILTSAVWKTQPTSSRSKASLSFCDERNGLNSRVGCAFNQKLRSSRRPLRVVARCFFRAPARQCLAPAVGPSGLRDPAQSRYDGAALKRLGVDENQ